MNRRTLLGRLVAALVAAPVLAVLPSKPAEAEPSDEMAYPLATYEDVGLRLTLVQYDMLAMDRSGRWLAWRMTSDAPIQYADDITPGERQWVDWKLGLGPLTFEAMQPSVGPGDGSVPHTLTIRPIEPNSVTPIAGEIVPLASHAFVELPHPPGHCADCDFWR